jgi:hypothetical protein
MSSVYVEYAFGWRKLSGLLYMLMIMELCMCTFRAEVADINVKRRIKFQAEI